MFNVKMTIRSCEAHALYIFVCVEPWEFVVGDMKLLYKKWHSSCTEKYFYLKCGIEVGKIHLALGNISTEC